jgi:hypothetical protein
MKCRCFATEHVCRLDEAIRRSVLILLAMIYKQRKRINKTKFLSHFRFAQLDSQLSKTQVTGDSPDLWRTSFKANVGQKQ